MAGQVIFQTFGGDRHGEQQSQVEIANFRGSDTDVMSIPDDKSDNTVSDCRKSSQTDQSGNDQKLQNAISRASNAYRDRQRILSRISVPISASVTSLFSKTLKCNPFKATVPVINTDFLDASNFTGDRMNYWMKLVQGVTSSAKIISFIIGAMETREMLNCRLISHTWESVATSHLRKRLDMHFFMGKQFFVTLKGSHLRELTDFLRTTSNKGYFDSFPCSRFIFHGQGLSSPSLQEFLNVQGKFIQELSVLDSTRFHYPGQSPQETEQVVMDQVKNLLLRQAQNLQLLELDIRPIVEWTPNEKEPSREMRSPIRIQDPEFIKIHSTEFVEGLKVNENLKQFDFGGSTSSKIFEMVIRLAPELDEVSMTEENYAWLMEPYNRRHLLKNLQLYGHERSLVKKTVMVQSIHYVALRKPRSMYRYSNFDKYFDISEWKPPYPLETVVLINRVLKCCMSSIHTISWQPSNLFREITWPRVMRNLTKIQFSSPVKAEAKRKEIQYLFPEGFSIRKTFPRLKTVYFHIFESPKNFMYLLESWNCKTVSSVTYVRISCFGFSCKRISKADLKPIGVLFPNSRCDVDDFNDSQKKNTLHQVSVIDD